ncbi:MAG TPA: hypothetical protein VFQ72_01110 [Candidatus Paceibacterota bacterium]|nr:hypothetical protein [Candidatus Paceibacterota bacterium]
MKPNNFLQKIGIERGNLKPFSLFVLGIILVTTAFTVTPFFATIGPAILIIVFGVFFSILWFVAGYAVFRSLLVASVGLSFIIFIGQSYCDLPIDERVADSALMTLIGFGFIYVTAQFGKSLYKELFGDKDAKEDWKQKGMIGVLKEINQNKHSWLALITYGLLISLFIWQVNSVIRPIINGLCVY